MSQLRDEADQDYIAEDLKQDDDDDVYIKQHSSYEQVMLDVNRCAGRIERLAQQKLAKLIVKLLIKKPGLHYYQGFHDVCLTYMTLMGEDKAFTTLDHLVDSHFKTFMQPTMNETQDFLALIPVIIGLHDYRVQDFLSRAEVGTIFALSWVITWFSHVIQDANDVERIFKFLEKEDPHMVLYLCASIVIHKKDMLLRLEPEMSAVHQFLSRIPRMEKLPLRALINDATTSFNRWTPEVLKQKLDHQRRSKIRLYDYNLLSSLANQFGIVTSNAKTAVVVFIIASFIALQFDRWVR